jgi:hypothetical protein
MMAAAKPSSKANRLEWRTIIFDDMLSQSPQGNEINTSDQKSLRSRKNYY